MKKNLTLTLDDTLLRAARKIAIERDTSVNNLVREYLANLIEEAHREQTAFARREEARARINEIFRTSKITLGPITWTRDDLHER